jgi:hypothetical protein
MLGKWLVQLEKLRTHGGMVMLPYNFADQCTAWLRVSSPDGVHAELQAGWSILGQFHFSPSEFAAVGNAVTDFEPICNARARATLDDLIVVVTVLRDRFDRVPR